MSRRSSNIGCAQKYFSQQRSSYSNNVYLRYKSKNTVMKPLTKAEEQIMQIIWQKERCLVRDIVDALETPIPQTTVSSVVRILERKGFVSHKAYGKTYEYFPIVAKEDFTKSSIKTWINNYFDGSPKQLVSFLVTENELGLSELNALMKQLETVKKDTKK